MSSSASGIVPDRRLAVPAASVLLYWAGMALNDFADRELDLLERPERPIPSGRVHPGEALMLAAGLSGAGVATAAWAGGRPAARTALALASTVWAYDLVLKNGPAGPAAMATARALDVVLGAVVAGPGGNRATGLRPAVAVGLHTAGVTLLSRGEVHGSDPGRAGTATVATLLAAATAASAGRRRPLALGLASVYAVAVARAQVAAVRSPDAVTVRTATGAGIRGLVPLQAALLAGQGASRTAVALLALGPVLRAASRKVSPT
jgi:4-hydroxybenzoate polyprenyltransferase